jgi:hypothetical protein
MLGEYHVLRSIVEYSLPRLVGWANMLDASMEQSIQKAASESNNMQSPHNYQSFQNNNKNNQGGGSGNQGFPF